MHVGLGFRRCDVVDCVSTPRSRLRAMSLLPFELEKQANRDNSFSLSETADSSEQLIGASRLCVPKMNCHPHLVAGTSKPVF